MIDTKQFFTIVAAGVTIVIVYRLVVSPLATKFGMWEE